MTDNVSNYDPKLSPKEVQSTISALGIKKANTKPWHLLLLGILAGIYISFGGQCFLAAMEQGMGRVVGGMVFSIGLVLVVIAGAELFTGNITMIVGTLTRQYSLSKMLLNWGIVYIGNFVGAYLMALLVYWSGLLGTIETSISPVGQVAVRVSEFKLAMPFLQEVIRGILCNILVILAIIMSYFSKDIISKIVCIILPITVFIASGYEHCVANMYLIPAGLLAKGTDAAGMLQIFNNIIPVTIGNIIGGIFIVVLHPNRIRQIFALIRTKKSVK
ncbi:MAG: formate/nitrite transporter family protein [Elusimicrobiota bacterium]